MKATLANFGDAIRVVHDMTKAPVVINIGKIVETDIEPVAYDFILRAQMKGDTLLLVPNGTKEVPEQLRDILELLSDVETGPYDAIVQRLTKLLGADAVELRPTKPQIRHQLKSVAAAFCKSNAEMLANALKESRTERPKEQEPTDPALRVSLGLSEKPPTPRERVRVLPRERVKVAPPRKAPVAKVRAKPPAPKKAKARGRR
jgi:hypothetical protein